MSSTKDSADENAANSQNTRNTRKRQSISIEETNKIKERRLELLSEKIKDALQRETRTNEPKKAKPTLSVAYSTQKEMPPLPSLFKVHCDVNAKSILLPISGVMFPLHVQYIKNIQMSKNDKIPLLQITIDPILSKETKKKPMAYVKELIFRSNNAKNFENIVSDFKKMKKEEAGEKNLSLSGEKLTLQKQDGIIMLKSKSETPKISHIKMRPILAKNKKSAGELEAHANGFLFRPSFSKTANFAIFYENVENAFFQPAENSPSVLLHFRLKNPVKLARPSRDVQFYVDVIDSSVKTENNIRSDQDAIREEQKEQDFKTKINRIFKAFTKNAAKVAKEHCPEANLRFEQPYDDVKFSGVPDRSSVSIYPTTNCLVSLEEYPPFILPLKDIEIAHFERVQYQLRQFDIVFVLKGLTSFKRIDVIPIEHLAFLRKYLEDANVLYFTSSINLDWGKILKEINSNRREFWENGGWKFLHKGEEDKASSAEASSESSGANDFSPSEEDGDESSESAQEALESEDDESDE